MSEILEGFRRRLLSLEKQSGLKEAPFCKKLGISSGIYRTAVGRNPQRPGRYGPSLETIVKIIENLQEIDTHWLLTGEGSPDPEYRPPDLQIQSVPRFRRFNDEIALEQYIPVRLLKDSMAAGAPSEINEGDWDGWCLIYADEKWMPNPAENYTCVRVIGDSMAPILSSGDIVAIDHKQRDPDKLNGEMVAFRVNSGVTIKWLKFLKKQKTVVGVPENRDELDHVITLYDEEIDQGIVGKIAWWLAKR